MPTAMLLLGQVQTMAQNVVFALPPMRCVLFCSTAGPTFQQSNDVAFGDNAAVTLSGGQAEVCGGFVRNTNAASAIVILKKA